MVKLHFIHFFTYKNDYLIVIIQFFIQKGASAIAKNNMGDTPLHVRCYCYAMDNTTKEEAHLKSFIDLFRKWGRHEWGK